MNLQAEYDYGDLGSDVGLHPRTGGGGGEAAAGIAIKATMSVEEALKARRTVREFAARGLDLPQVSQLLWGADGLSDA